MSDFFFVIEAIAVLLLGNGLGVVVNYLADVLPHTRRFSPVRCHHCQQPYSWKEYLLLRHCSYCGTRRSRRAFVVQIVFSLLTLALWLWPPPDRLPLVMAWGVLLYFGVVFVIDWEHRVVLYQVSAVGVVLGAGVGIWLNGWQSALLGGGLGFGIMLVLYYLGEVFMRWTAGRRGLEAGDEVALGFGDVTLSGVLGLMLGWPRIGIGLFFAILLGGLVGGLYLLWLVLRRRYQPFAALPYTPYLLIVAAVLMYLA